MRKYWPSQLKKSQPASAGEREMTPCPDTCGNHRGQLQEGPFGLIIEVLQRGGVGDLVQQRLGVSVEWKVRRLVQSVAEPRSGKRFIIL